MSLSDSSSPLSQDAIPLLILPQPGDSAPIRLDITLTTSDEVLQLRSRVSDLEADLLRETSDRKRAEWKYACECNLRMQLCDYLREHDIKIPKRYFDQIF